MASTATDSRAVIAGQTLTLSRLARQLADQARAKILGTDFDALSDTERAAAYAEIQAMVRSAEHVSEEAARSASAL